MKHFASVYDQNTQEIIVNRDFECLCVKKDCIFQKVLCYSTATREAQQGCIHEFARDRKTTVDDLCSRLTEQYRYLLD